MDTIQMATKEAESWRVAQMAAETINIGGEDQPIGGDQTSQGTEVGMWKCQVDASWIEDQGDTGLGFVLLDDERTTLFGFKGNISSASPLHAEAEDIIWAMQEILKSGRREIQILSDCEQLVKIILTDMEWPALAPELDEIKAFFFFFGSNTFIHS